MAEMRVTIQEIDDAEWLFVVKTSGGTFKLQRGTLKLKRHELLRTLNHCEKNGQECILRYTPQKTDRSVRHTLMSARIAS